MAFDINGVRFLLTAGAGGVNFDRIAMLGRQKLHMLTEVLQGLMTRFGYTKNDNQVQSILNEDERFAEPFLRLLRAECVDSFDASPHEKAACIQDMNKPIPDFTMVYTQLL